MPRPPSLRLVPESFLRRIDARTKLVIGLAASAAAMLPLAPLALFTIAFSALALAARLGTPIATQLRRLGPWLAVLLVGDWLCIGPAFALLISLRLVLLTTAFTVLVATTTPDELQSALERLRVPARMAYTVATAYRSLALLEGEWRTIVEAQHARGLGAAPRAGRGWRASRLRLGEALALVVPAIVLATQRAWALHESAAARSLESPRRCALRAAPLSALDHLLLAASAGVLLSLLVWR